MTSTTPNRRDRRRGGSLVEFAITMPLLLLMTVAASDFARVFWEAAAISRASETAAKYGAQSNQTSTQYAAMERLADNSSSHIEGSVSTADRVCDCPDAPGTWVSCLTTMCPNYGQPRAYSRVGVSKTFSMMGYYPGLPQNTDISLRGYMRIQ